MNQKHKCFICGHSSIHGDRNVTKKGVQRGRSMQDIREKANAVSRIKDDLPENKTVKAAAKEEAEDIISDEGRKSSHSKSARVLAIIALAILAFLVIWLVVCIITDSPHTMAVLFCVIFFPIVIYIMFWLKKVFGGKS